MGPDKMTGKRFVTDFDFDRPITRLGTHCSKWDGLGPRFGDHAVGALPMWVADMEFAAPPAVTDVLREAVEHGVHGYYGDPASYHAAIQGWMKRRHGWEIETGWIHHRRHCERGEYGHSGLLPPR